jgi:hypothetical protein
MTNLSPGVEAIEHERIRQIKIEKFSLRSDKSYQNFELIFAAKCYLSAAVDSSKGEEIHKPSDWPFADDWWKPSSDPARNLEKAGALIAAEFDRQVTE